MNRQIEILSGKRLDGVGAPGKACRDSGVGTFAGLLPPGVVVERFSDQADAALHAAEEACVRDALPKRRREFAAGRACARRALMRLGIRDFPLLRGPSCAPIWPEGIVGSITHCERYVAAAVARVDHLLGIGIDAEPSTPLAPKLVALVCTPGEIARLDGLPPGVEWTKLMFSAKESFYKCYHPRTRYFLDFLDVELDFQPGTTRFSARLVRPDAPSIFGRRQLEGRFAKIGSTWLTQVSESVGVLIRSETATLFASECGIRK